jgi:predicted Zn-dependent protease with MMP-like domain
MELSDEQFEDFLDEAIKAVPQPYNKRLENVAFLIEDYPSAEQRQKLNLYPNETLFGLYEGVPLTKRGGALKLLPDKITVFKQPLLAVSRTPAQLRRNIGHTIWHEVAHYFGLDHDRIHRLDAKRQRSGSL